MEYIMIFIYVPLLFLSVSECDLEEFYISTTDDSDYESGESSGDHLLTVPVSSGDGETGNDETATSGDNLDLDVPQDITDTNVIIGGVAGSVVAVIIIVGITIVFIIYKRRTDQSKNNAEMKDDDRDNNTYDDLNKSNQQSETNTYETLKVKESNEDKVDNVYVNTMIGLGDGIKQ